MKKITGLLTGRVKADADTAACLECGHIVLLPPTHLQVEYYPCKKCGDQLEHCNGSHCAAMLKGTCHCACTKCWDAKLRDV